MKKQVFAAILAMFLALPALAQQKKFNDWGWPMPYEKVSAKSIEWLKDKGWWPVQVAVAEPLWCVPVLRTLRVLRYRPAARGKVGRLRRACSHVRA